MGMRVLLMISNSNMAARELYTRVLREQFPGWGLSNMSALPPGAGHIIKSFDVLVYELGAPDDPQRYKSLLALHDEIKPLETVGVITRIEGPYREGIVAELEGRGIVCVAAPFGTETVAAAFQRLAPPQRASSGPRPGLGERLRGLFQRRG